MVFYYYFNALRMQLILCSTMRSPNLILNQKDVFFLSVKSEFRKKVEKRE